MRRNVRWWTGILMAASAWSAVACAGAAGPSPARAPTASPAGRAGVLTNSLGMRLVFVPAGEFLMGAEEDEASLRKAFPYVDPALMPREGPRHKVRITKAFYLGETEVTLGQFMTFVRATHYKVDAENGQTMTGYDASGRTIESTAFRPWAPGYPVADTVLERSPVGYVSWNDAVAFCAWLSRKEGRTYRLPTEAEWEYACRAGTSTRFSFGDDPQQLVHFANAADADRAALFPGRLVDVFDASGKKTGERMPYPFLRGHDGYAWTAPGGSFGANAFGLRDMHGNSWEWCSDWFGEDFYKASPVDDPHGPATGEIRVSRGGAFDNSPYSLRCARRDGGTPESHDNHDGFRVVLEP